MITLLYKSLPTAKTSHETYLGHGRGQNFASGTARIDESATYQTTALTLGQWGLDGQWTVGKEMSRLDAPGGKISFRFNARDVHLVLAPGQSKDNEPGKTVRFKVTLDGKIPGDGRGVDVAADGSGTVTQDRLYQLIRLKTPGEHTFTIEFADPGVQAFAFTFG